ncbi:MAG: hypothetical protein GOMPHAMPRED_003857 [Gomphillus americanus]|uniref:Uncharacterized protein n=1 Tax=Gomphillus americanus TaxID=1940652 RepID=A0A8H3FP29_9LECA|nr:MAG: hypothetical protein GOMPHAMPRED_003857 [Gomphillus americanus]
MDSPPSEPLDTRFSTPVSELDDHRTPPAVQSIANMGPDTWPQSGSLHSPRHEGAAKVDTVATIPELPETAPKSRDFETAIIDDDKSVVDEQAVMQSPIRKFSRRIRENVGQIIGHSRASSSSTRSSSPNSVDAFAGPRIQERRGTFSSQGPSDFGGLQRTASGGTRAQRPIFDTASVRLPDHVTINPRPEEDVCFPVTEEPTKSFTIDYEEIEEFVALSTRGRPHIPTRQRHSFSSQDKRRPAGKPTPGNLLPEESNSFVNKMDSASLCKVQSGSSHLANEKQGIPSTDRGNGFDGPNRFSFFSSKMPQTIHAPEMGDLIVPGETFRDLFELPNENGAWWLDVLNPTEDELEMIQKAFGIHRLTAEDIEAQEIREKVELFHQYYFVCFRSFFPIEDHEDYLEPLSMYMVVFREGILTFTYKQSPHAAEVRKRIGKLRNYINLTADWICYALVDNIVDSFAPVLNNLEIEADTIEDSVYVAREEDLSQLLRRLGDCRKKVMTLLRLLGGKADVIKGFAKRCNEQFGVAPRGEIGLYLGDIQDHVITMMSNLAHFEKMLSRTHSNYFAQLSVDNLRQANRANEVLSKITLIASILVPLNLVCGLFGMNVAVPGGVNPGDPTDFYIICGCLGGFVVVSLIAAKRARWI